MCGHASASGRPTSGLCIQYLFPSDIPPVGPRLDKVRAHTHPRPHARPGALDTASLNLRAQCTHSSPYAVSGRIAIQASDRV